VGDDADMGVECGVGPQRQQVAALLGVDEQDLLPRPQEALVGRGRSPDGVRGAQDFGLDVGSEEPELITRRSPGRSRVL
jgi:hypothetical protein